MMIYTVTFYAAPSDGDETAVVVQRVKRTALRAYTKSPVVVLQSIRVAHKGRRVDGFRIVDGEGSVVLDFSDRVG